ncbi:hypothetical protein PDN55_11440 [Bacillus cereus]|nr:hypothetical protein [Bacillus cereus]
MGSIIEVFKERKGKSVASLIVLILSVVAMFGYQDIKVETIQSYLNVIDNNQVNSEVIWTLGMNFLSLVLNVLMVVMWFKDIVAKDFSKPLIGRIVSAIIGVIHIIFVLSFINYIFSSLSGVIASVVLFVAIMWAIFGGRHNKNK